MKSMYVASQPQFSDNILVFIFVCVYVCFQKKSQSDFLLRGRTATEAQLSRLLDFCFLAKITCARCSFRSAPSCIALIYLSNAFDLSEGSL